MALYFRKYNFPSILRHTSVMNSNYLKRKVILDTYSPRTPKSAPYNHPVIIFNDGQLLRNMDISKILRKLLKIKKIQPCIIIGIHSDQNRHHELGTTQFLEANGHGIFAQAYQEFILKELMSHLHIDSSHKIYIAGFSLGGLSALDISLNHPNIFSGVGVFSGALWWRDRPFQAKRPNAHLIIPQKIHLSHHVPNIKYWFLAGTLEETNDRDKNGIIDVIDDTLNTIVSLQRAGVSPKNISYVEVKGGKHQWQTWAKAMPRFLMTICAS